MSCKNILFLLVFMQLLLSPVFAYQESSYRSDSGNSGSATFKSDNSTVGIKSGAKQGWQQTNQPKVPTGGTFKESSWQDPSLRPAGLIQSDFITEDGDSGTEKKEVKKDDSL